MNKELHEEVKQALTHPWAGKPISVLYPELLSDLWFLFGTVEGVRNEAIAIVTTELDMYLQGYRESEAKMPESYKKSLDEYRKKFMKDVAGIDV